MTKIVIIDDDKDLVSLIKEIIESYIEDSKVFTAYDGEEGLRIIKKRRPDLIILDLNIPALSGYEVCDYLKKSKEFILIPVLIITGSGQSTETRIKSFDVGADGFIGKPFEVSELVSRIKALIKLKIVEDALVKQRDMLRIDVNLKEKEIKKNYYELKQFFNAFIQVMATTIDSLSIYNFNSTKKVADMVEEFINYINDNKKGYYKDLSFSPEKAEDLITAAWLHDIGKILLSPRLMNKTTRLGDSYHTVMQRLEIIYYWDQATGKRFADRVMQAKRLVEKYNDPFNEIDNEAIEQIDKIASLQYNTSSDEKRYWLSDYERECLSVKNGTLTENERTEVKRHVQLTDMLLSKIPFPKDKSRIRKWAITHHELLDGTGYWRGLKGKEIPVETRILTIIDIFEAMTSSERKYRRNCSGREAMDVLKSLADRGKLDSDLVDLFEKSKIWQTIEQKEVEESNDS